MGQPTPLELLEPALDDDELLELLLELLDDEPAELLELLELPVSQQQPSPSPATTIPSSACTLTPSSAATWIESPGMGQQLCWL